MLTRSPYDSGEMVSLCEVGVLNNSYVLRRQTIFTQIIPAREEIRRLLPKEITATHFCTGQR